MSIWDRLKKYRAEGPRGLSRAIELLPQVEFESKVGADLDARLVPAGFIRLSKRRWGREWATQINALIELEPLKGAFTAAWGLSLPFIPHLTDDFRIGWHRTLRAARFDLSYHPRDYARERSAWTVSQLATREELAVESPGLADDVVKGAVKFLEPLKTVEDLPAAYEAKRTRPFVSFGFENYPQEMVALAFVLAKCGKAGEAQMKMDEYVARVRRFGDGENLLVATVDELHRLLSQV